MEASTAAPSPPYAGLDSKIANNGADGNQNTRESRGDRAPLTARQKLALNVVQKTADKFRAEYAGAAALDIRVVHSRDEIPVRYH